MHVYNKRMLNFYHHGRIASDTEEFQVWGCELGKHIPEFTPVQDGEVPPNHFIMQGEIGTDFCEMLEVAAYFNSDNDGCFYYVGNRYTGAILKPSWREIRWMSQLPSISSDYGAHTHTSGHGRSVSPSP